MNEHEREHEHEQSFPYDKIITRGGGGIAIAALIYMNTTLLALHQDLSKVKTSLVAVQTELNIVSPSDIRNDLQKISGDVVTEARLEKILDRLHYPWKIDKPEWQSWRNRIDMKFDNLEMKVRELEGKK